MQKAVHVLFISIPFYDKYFREEFTQHLRYLIVINKFKLDIFKQDILISYSGFIDYNEIFNKLWEIKQITSTWYNIYIDASYTDLHTKVIVEVDKLNNTVEKCALIAELNQNYGELYKQKFPKAINPRNDLNFNMEYKIRKQDGYDFTRFLNDIKILQR